MVARRAVAMPRSSFLDQRKRRLTANKRALCGSALPNNVRMPDTARTVQPNFAEGNILAESAGHVVLKVENASGAAP